jgi:MOSC domain-containing protein YiiM
MQGRVEGIFVTPEHGELPVSVASARAVARRGLEGNRYFLNDEAPSGRSLTLIAAEAVEALEREHGIALEAAATRRNVLTRGSMSTTSSASASASVPSSAKASSSASRAHISSR